MLLHFDTQAHLTSSSLKDSSGALLREVTKQDMPCSAGISWAHAQSTEHRTLRTQGWSPELRLTTGGDSASLIVQRAVGWPGGQTGLEAPPQEKRSNICAQPIQPPAQVPVIQSLSWTVTYQMVNSSSSLGAMRAPLHHP